MTPDQENETPPLEELLQDREWVKAQIAKREALVKKWDGRRDKARMRHELSDMVQQLRSYLFWIERWISQATPPTQTK